MRHVRLQAALLMLALACTHHASAQDAAAPASTPAQEPASPSAAYFQGVEDVLAQRLRYPAESLAHKETGHAVVRLHLRRDGGIAGIELVQPTHYAALDEEAVNVFKRIGHFAAMPDDMAAGVADFTFQLPIDFTIN